jgi:hypothetical protein
MNGIREKDWGAIDQNLRQEKGLPTKNEEKLRLFDEAIWYISRTGCNGALFLAMMEIGEQCIADFFVVPEKEWGIAY